MDLTVFTPRSVIRAAEPVMYLIPKIALIIAAQVSPINIDELFVSQDVTLRFSALDQRQTPELFGKVVRFPQTPLWMKPRAPPLPC